MKDSLISLDPGIMLGKPVVRGTRITVDLVVRKFSEGATEADVLDAYPHLTREGEPPSRTPRTPYRMKNSC